MRVDDFDYPLPEELIADRPSQNRADSRLMLVNREKSTIEHHSFRDLPRLLQAGDVLVFNHSRVIPARLFGTKRGGGARIEILLLEEKGDHCWEALAQRAIRLNPGTCIDFTDGDCCHVAEVLGEGRFILRFSFQGTWLDFLNRVGSVPIPPYILKQREKLPAEEQRALAEIDRERYQTEFAEIPGSAAAPTAGLHFDQPLLAELRTQGLQLASVVLHVGLDTFSPVVVEQVEDHKMKSEWCYCPGETAQLIEETSRRNASRVIAVGTTSCRAIESCARLDWPADPIRTALFIKPGDPFLVTEGLLTNFHLPKSTLLMLVSAFMGNDLRKRAYEAAVKEKYRFYSYGDAMLII